GLLRSLRQSDNRLRRLVMTLGEFLQTDVALEPFFQRLGLFVLLLLNSLCQLANLDRSLLSHIAQVGLAMGKGLKRLGAFFLIEIARIKRFMDGGLKSRQLLQRRRQLDCSQGVAETGD